MALKYLRNLKKILTVPDYILIFVLFGISVLLFYTQNTAKPDTGMILNIYQNNRSVRTLEIDSWEKYQVHKVVDISGKGFVYKLELTEKGVRALESSCPNHICIEQGYINKPGQAIICVPNKVLARLDAKDPNYIREKTDAISE